MTDTLMGDDTGDQPVIDPTKDYLEDLVGEGKKFKTPSELARGKLESDLYIKQMERRLDELRSDYLALREEHNAGPKLQELIDRIAEERRSSSELPPAKDETKLAFDPNDIESIFDSRLQKYENTKREQENLSRIKNKLVERFGTNYQNAYQSQLDQLGLTKEFADTLAKTQPVLFERTFGLDQKPQPEGFQSPPRSEFRNTNFTPSTNKRTWSFYQKMKAEDRNKYLDPKTMVQMQKDAIALGRDFEDGDFHYGEPIRR